MDGDGLDDILVGAAGYWEIADVAGAVHLLHGPVAGSIDLDDSDALLFASEEGSAAGSSVVSAGDTNGDGYADILVGAPWASGVEEGAGAAYLVLGPVSGDVDLEDADAILLGEATSDSVGGVPEICPQAVASAGDVDGDGLDDLLVGAPGVSRGGASAGAAYLVLSPSEGRVDLGDADARLRGEDAGDLAGFSVAGVGDANGDGLDDLAVGAAAEDSVDSWAGAAYLVLGTVRGNQDLRHAEAKLTATLGDTAGFAVSGGDVDQDGYADLLVGVPGYGSGTYLGAAYLLLGPVSGARRRWKRRRLRRSARGCDGGGFRRRSHLRPLWRWSIATTGGTLTSPTR